MDKKEIQGKGSKLTHFLLLTFSQCLAMNSFVVTADIKSNYVNQITEALVFLVQIQINHFQWQNAASSYKLDAFESWILHF